MTKSAICRNCGVDLETVTFCPDCGMDFVRDRVDEVLRNSFACDWLREEQELSKRLIVTIIIQRARVNANWKDSMNLLMERSQISVSEIEAALEESNSIDFRSAYELAAEKIFLGDLEESVNLAKPAALDGDRKAQHLLGGAFLEGPKWGVSEDAQEAANWFRRAANQNYAPAQYQLGLLYYEGKGVIQNKKEAMHLFKKAAAQGIVLAECELAEIYHNADDEKAAFMWFERAASRHYCVAQYNVGIMYENGLGVALDHEKAEYWWKKAAAQGYSDAIEKLKQVKKTGT